MDEMDEREMQAARKHEVAELLAEVSSIGLDEMPDMQAYLALQTAIKDGKVIGVYRQHITGEWTIELNHFGTHSMVRRDQEPRRTCREWMAEYYAILNARQNGGAA